MPNNNGYLIAAYVVTWVVIVAYTVRLYRVARRAESQYADAMRGDGAGESR